MGPVPLADLDVDCYFDLLKNFHHHDQPCKYSHHIETFGLVVAFSLARRTSVLTVTLSSTVDMVEGTKEQRSVNRSHPSLGLRRICLLGWRSYVNHTPFP
jgi:hypothetical protein